MVRVPIIALMGFRMANKHKLSSPPIITNAIVNVTSPFILLLVVVIHMDHYKLSSFQAFKK